MIPQVFHVGRGCQIEVVVIRFQVEPHAEGHLHRIGYGGQVEGAGQKSCWTHRPCWTTPHTCPNRDLRQHADFMCTFEAQRDRTVTGQVDVIRAELPPDPVSQAPLVEVFAHAGLRRIGVGKSVAAVSACRILDEVGQRQSRIRSSAVMGWPVTDLPLPGRRAPHQCCQAVIGVGDHLVVASSPKRSGSTSRGTRPRSAPWWRSIVRPVVQLQVGCAK